jgi:NAD dependent epimerase/dehydratase family enzyme
MPAPAFMMRLMLGELADVVLTGQKILPQKLTAAGFEFLYPAIDKALQHLLGES